MHFCPSSVVIMSALTILEARHIDLVHRCLPQCLNYSCNKQSIHLPIIVSINLLFALYNVTERCSQSLRQLLQMSCFVSPEPKHIQFGVIEDTFEKLKLEDFEHLCLKKSQ